MKNFFKSGFSLVEVMISVALLGVVSLGTLQVMKNVSESSKTSEVSMEVNSVTNSINQALINSESCTNTFKGLGPIQSNLSVNEIKNRTDDTLFDTTQKYGNNQIKISSMILTDVTIKPLEPGFSKKFGNFKLEVRLDKIGKGFTGQKSVKKYFPIGAEFDLTNNLLKCYSSSEDAIATAEAESCHSIGGTWVLATHTCTLGTTIGKNISASTENLDTQINDLINNHLPTNYVKKAGDTMTGALTISGANLTAVDVNASNKINATTSVCVGNRCRDFNLKQCNKDSISVGINPDGSPICTAVVCQQGYYLERFDAGSGLPTCKAIPTATCPVNQYISEIRPNGTVVCSPLPPGTNQTCPQGQHIQRIDPKGLITCSNPNVGLTCGATSFVAGFDADGKAVCRSTAKLKLAFNCATISLPYNNNSDNQHQSISCGGNSFLNGIMIQASSRLDAFMRGTCCTPYVSWDPPDPTLPLPSISRANSQITNPGYQYGSDNQDHVATCSGGKAMHYLRLYAADQLEELEDYYCATPKLSNLPEGYNYSLGLINCRTMGTGYSDGSDDQYQSLGCANEEVLTMINIRAGSRLEYLKSYQCCRMILNE